jgi:hypothetical protein
VAAVTRRGAARCAARTPPVGLCRRHSARAALATAFAAAHRGASGRLDAASARRLAHELFHRWLGTGLQATGPSLNWFKEGVTEYVAHWAVVHCGLATEPWFAGELLSMRGEIARNRLIGRVRLGEPEAEWRRDPEREELIYKKAPLVAFLADAALRRREPRGILRMIGALLERPEAAYGLSAVRDELAALGQGELVRTHINRPGLPGGELDRALHAAGFRVPGPAGAARAIGVRRPIADRFFGRPDRPSLP